MRAAGTPDLARIALALGVKIVEGQPIRGKGHYEHHRQRIVMRPGLSEVQYRCTLSHELGHAYWRDEPTGDARYDARQERAADQFAARLLIHERDVRIAETIHGPRWGAIAHELGVTEQLLTVWRGLHQRVNA